MILHARVFHGGGAAHVTRLYSTVLHVYVEGIMRKILVSNDDEAEDRKLLQIYRTEAEKEREKQRLIFIFEAAKNSHAISNAHFFGEDGNGHFI